MSLENPYLLLLLILAPLPWVLTRAWLKRRKKRLEQFADRDLIPGLIINDNSAKVLSASILSSVILSLLITAAAGPQIRGGKETVKLRGIDLVVVLDISNSMKATDLKPDRLERAKTALGELVTRLEGDRLGVVVFAGQPYAVLPLCEDKSAAEMIISSISTDMTSVQGTAVGAALELAVKSFRNSEEGRGKAIILISDGENHEDDAVKAAEDAVENGIVVSSIGIGSESGTTIPETDENGVVTLKKDNSGQTVITKLNSALLKDVARAGKGTYVKASNSDLGINTIYDQLRDLSKTTQESVRYTSITPLFQWPLGAALALIIIQMFGALKNILKSKKAK